jgi:hypothetical protein
MNVVDSEQRKRRKGLEDKDFGRFFVSSARTNLRQGG